MGNAGATGPTYQMWVGADTAGPDGYFFQRAITAEVPEPGSLALFALALAGLAAVRRSKAD